MIGRLRGTIVEIDPTGVLLIDVGGVGYELLAPLGLVARLRTGDEVELAIHTHVREDQITLFGFGSPRERALFRRLLGISGIGAKTALALLSTLPPDDLIAAVEAGDAARIARTPGIGKKTAQRLILELRGQLAEEASAHAAEAPGVGELRAALQGLGYKASEIDRVIAGIAPGPLDAMLRAALKALAS